MFRPIKYSLFPPLGLATLAGYLPPDAEVTLQDEHVERLASTTTVPDLVVIQVYITSARRAYRSPTTIGRAAPTSSWAGCTSPRCRTRRPPTPTPSSSAPARTPGRCSWPTCRPAHPGARYSRRMRTLVGLPPIRRDLIKRHRYLVPNSIVVSRGCPHHCDFCYKDAFFTGGKSFYTQTVDDALAEIDRLPGRHLYFLDDHLFGNRRFAEALFDGHGADGPGVPGAPARSTSCSRRGCSSRRSRPGCAACSSASRRSTPTTWPSSASARTRPRLRRGVRRLHDAGVMVNASFVFGMDDDGPDVFDRTVDVGGRAGHRDRHVPHHDAVPRHRALRPDRGAGADAAPATGTATTPATSSTSRGDMTASSWSAATGGRTGSSTAGASIWRGAAAQGRLGDRLRHLAYAGGWKKFEPLWDLLIRSRRCCRRCRCSRRRWQRSAAGRRPRVASARPRRRRPGACRLPSARARRGRRSRCPSLRRGRERCSRRARRWRRRAPRFVRRCAPRSRRPCRRAARTRPCACRRGPRARARGRASRIATAQRIARAGPSKVARKPSPAVSISRRGSARSRGARWHGGGEQLRPASGRRARGGARWSRRCR